MTKIWKRWFTNLGGMRIVLALLYLLATFSAPLSHTCCHVGTETSHQHLQCAGHTRQNDTYLEEHYTASLNQNSLDKKADSHELYCAACLYSLKIKIFKLSSNTSLCLTQAVAKTQVLPQFSFIKQLEWFCSAPLRAPPSIAS